MLYQKGERCQLIVCTSEGMEIRASLILSAVLLTKSSTWWIGCLKHKLFSNLNKSDTCKWQILNTAPAVVDTYWESYFRSFFRVLWKPNWARGKWRNEQQSHRKNPHDCLVNASSASKSHHLLRTQLGEYIYIFSLYIYIYLVFTPWLCKGGDWWADRKMIQRRGFSGSARF